MINDKALCNGEVCQVKESCKRFTSPRLESNEFVVVPAAIQGKGCPYYLSSGEPSKKKALKKKS